MYPQTSRTLCRVLVLFLTLILLGSARRPAPPTARAAPAPDAAALHALAGGQLLPASAPAIPAAALTGSLDTPPAAPAAAAAPPTSGALAFSSSRTGPYHIYQHNFAIASATTFIASPGDHYTPVWSPDGTQLVYATNNSGNTDIYLRTATGVIRRLTTDPANDIHPSWSPDGQHILFASDRSGLFQIYTVNLASLVVQPVGTVPGYNAISPRYAPDGSRIAFMRASVIVPDCSWNWDIWVMDANGGGQRRVTQQLGGDLYPNWSPDGTEIIYARCEYLLTSDLYAINPDNGLERQLTNTFFTSEWNGVYMQNGAYLAYNSANTLTSTDSEIMVVPVTNGIPNGVATNITSNPAPDLAPSWQGTVDVSACAGADNRKQPLLLAPGWGAADTIAEDTSGFGAMLPILEADGYRLGCNLFYAGTTSASVTLYQNGKRILDTLCQAYPQVDDFIPNWNGRFDIIGHSFGGLRSRAFLESPNLYDQTGVNGANCDNPALPPGKQLIIDNLFTLGSPHGGGTPDLAGAIAIGIPHIFNLDEWGSVQELFTMNSYNALHHQPENVCYRLVGGNAWAQPAMHIHFLSLLYTPLQKLIPNDLGVYRFSALALDGMDGYAHVVTSATHDMHGYSSFTANIDSYLSPDHTYLGEIREWLGQPITACPAGPTSPFAAAPPQATSAVGAPAAQWQLAAGELSSGATTAGAFTLAESGPLAVYLSWGEGDMSLALTAPDGTALTPDTAVTLPGVTYNSGTIMARLAGYTVDTPLTGTWGYTVTAGTLPRPMPFQLTAVPDRAITLAAGAPAWQPLHTPVIITAALSVDGVTPLAGAAITATIARPDGGTATLTLLDDGLHGDGAASDGTYGQSYTATTAGGHYLAALTATGTYQAQPYTRTSSALFTVAPPTAALGSTYQETLRATAVPGLYNWLDIGLTVETAVAGTYAIAADLVSAGGSHVARALTTVDLAASTHAITLSFYGDTIRAAGLDGPYTLTALQVADIGGPTLLLTRADNVYTTAAYSHTAFGSVQPAYLPLVIKP